MLISPRRRLGSKLVLSTGLLASLLVGGVAVEAATRSVAIADFAFGPAALTITAGDRVRWTNADQVAHTATANNGSFDTGDIEQGESATIRFTQAGTYRYVCTPHPTMTGTIRVLAAQLPATDTDAGIPTPAGLDPGAVLALAGGVLVVGLRLVRRRLLA